MNKSSSESFLTPQPQPLYRSTANQTNQPLPAKRRTNRAALSAEMCTSPEEFVSSPSRSGDNKPLIPQSLQVFLSPLGIVALDQDGSAVIR
jgi:hypothetical protein